MLNDLKMRKSQRPVGRAARASFLGRPVVLRLQYARMVNVVIAVGLEDVRLAGVKRRLDVVRGRKFGC